MTPIERSHLATVAAIAALAAGLGLAAAVGPIGRRDVAPADVPTRVTAAAVGALVGFVAVLALVVALRKRAASLRGVAGALMLVGAVVGGLAAVDATNDGTARSAPAPPAAATDGSATAGGAGTRQPPPPADASRRGDLDVDTAGTAVLLVGLALLIGAMVFFARRTGTREVGREAVYLRSDLDPDALDDEADDDALVEAVRTGRHRLDGTGSPADRILAAYATMLDRLADSGLPRRRHEPPGAYLGRCLRSRPLPSEPTATLLRLFELARFSRVPIGEADVDVARRALDDLLARLERVAT